jgi:dTDP-4-amino-4,6-dideoxygalactose transaminase
LPLHLSERGKAYGGREGDCPVTEEMSDRLVRLPMFFDLTLDEQAHIIETVRNFE